MHRTKSKKIAVIFFSLILLTGLVNKAQITARTNTVNPPDSIKAMNNIFTQIAKNVMPAVVLIKVTRVASARRMHPLFRHFFRQRNRGRQQPKRRVQGVGSGVIISKKGYIVTNHHVIKGAKGLSVMLVNNREFKVKVVGVDKETDMAVLKILGDISKISYAEMGNSDNVKPGEIVFALGNPFGLKGSITQGIISAVSRQTQRSYGYDFLQTDAAINPGNSGGPLVNIYGKVIGINRMIYTRTGGYMGIGFAIPINRVKEVISTIIKHGKVTRGYLGVIPANPDEKTSRKMKIKFGVKIAEVMEGSPADKAGLKPWDVIIKVNGKRIKNFGHLKRVISLKRPGKPVKITVRRKNRVKTFSVVLANRESAISSNDGSLGEGGSTPGSRNTYTMFGMTLRSLTVAEKKRHKVRYGVVVTRIKPDSSAMDAGIRPGDVILEIESLKMTSISRAKQIFSNIKNKDTFQMRIKRRGRIRFMVIEK